MIHTLGFQLIAAAFDLWGDNRKKRTATATVTKPFRKPARIFAR
jgi:hypothetical protein